MKKLITIGLAGVLSISLLLLAPSAAGAAPYCGIYWGSTAKTAPDTTSGEELTNIRTGRHGCFDRMVFDLNGSASGYDVRYVDNVYADGSGQLIPLSGGAKLQIVLLAPAYDENGNPTYSATVGRPLPSVNLSGYQTFRDAKYAGSFEGQTTVGLGVRARLPFRVFTLAGPDRMVVDVAHYW